MVTRILFDPRRDLTTGSTSSTPVTLEATPTGIREDGSVVVLPTKLSFTVNTAADVVQLAPPAASWAWRLVARQDGVVQQQRTVRFADVASVTWADLVDVDPATLGETAGHARQWDATFFQLVEMIGTFSQQIDAITAGAPGALDSFFEVATKFGLDEATVTALTTLVAGKPDRTEVAATYLTFDGTNIRKAGNVVPIAGGGTSGVALDTDGVPYFSTSGTTAISLDTDGVPYLAA